MTSLILILCHISIFVTGDDRGMCPQSGLNLTMENHFWETGSTDSVDVDVDSQTFDFIMTGDCIQGELYYCLNFTFLAPSGE